MNTASAVAIGVTLFGFAFVSKRLVGTAVTAPIVFVGAGLLIGSEGLDLLDLRVGSSDLRLLTEATLAVVLFSDAAGLDIVRLRRQAGFPLRLLLLGLPLTIVAGTVVATLMFPDLGVFEALALAVLLAPTDAALGQAVVTDHRLPSIVRQGLNVESGLNDGICVPLLIAAITFAEIDEAPTFDGGILVDLVVELSIAVAVGLVVGILVGYLRNDSVRRGWITESWQLLVPLVATAVAYVVTVDLGGSGFIASFVAGLAYGWSIGVDAHHDIELTEDLGQLLSAATFVVFGAIMVGYGIADLDVSTILYAVLSLTVLRMGAVAVSMLGTGARLPTVAIVGWFGPRGLATIVFALIVVEESSVEGVQQITSVATVTVLLSVLAHGVSAPWLVGRYSRWLGSDAIASSFEGESVGLVRPTRGRWFGVSSNRHR